MSDTDRLNPLVAFLALGTDSIYARHAIALSERILDNPQAHIDALVEAGVLNKIDARIWSGHPERYTGDPVLVYAVVQPHKHEWYIRRNAPAAKPGLVPKAFIAACEGCTEEREVPNRLPIEVPDEVPADVGIEGVRFKAVPRA